MTDAAPDLNSRLSQLSRAERAALFAKLRQQKAVAHPEQDRQIGRRPAGSGPPPLSFAQQRLWFLDRMTPGDPAFNVATAVRIQGALDPAALRQALEGVSNRHETLRTTFEWAPQGPVQVIAPEAHVDLPQVDLSALPPEGVEDVLLRLCLGENGRSFDLATGPLLRATLVRLGAQSHCLILVMHHIVSDGWSMNILVSEIVAFYQRFDPSRQEEAVELPELPIQYADFAVWQREHLSGAVLEEQLGYWRDRLAGAPPALDLPTDRPRPALRTLAGTDHYVWIPAAPARALAQQQGATLFTALLAVFQALLQRWTGQTDLSVGTAVANRNRTEVAPLIGYFINSLVLRADLSGDPVFRDFLAQVRGTALGAFSRQDLPFEKLVEELRPERNPSRSPLYQVSLILQNTPVSKVDSGPLKLKTMSWKVDAAKLDLTLLIDEREGELSCCFNYNTDLFDAATIARLGDAFERLLLAAAADPGLRLSELPMLSESERSQMLLEWDGDALDPDEAALVPERIERMALLHPDRPALASGGRTISYGELRARVQELAHRLRARGVGPEVRVALVMERSLEAVVGLLAVMAAGGAYVPVDPALPEERREELLRQAGVSVVLTGEGEEILLTEPRTGLNTSSPGFQPRAGVDAGGALADLAADPLADPVGDPIGDLAADPTDLAPPPPPGVETPGYWSSPPPGRGLPENAAYVLFTSGSTGRPKGVVVEHRQLAAYVGAAIRRLGLEEDAERHFALVSTLAADLGNTVLFPALCTGGCLHVLSREQALDPEAFAGLAQQQPFDVLKIVPSHLASLLKGTRPELVVPRRVLVLGGEAASWELVDRVAELVPACRVFNHYGPTEATVGVIADEIDPASSQGERPPLGRPLAGSRVLLLGRSGELVAPGSPGELLVGGAGVARGYLGRPDLTAERFVPDPYAGLRGEPGARLYRTGDLARRLPGGRLEFLGRTDDQVKLRGYRVEPREVEAVLAAHPGVERCAVLARQDETGGLVLAAYVVPAPGSPPETAETTAESLRAFLSGRLPGFMVPSAFAFLDGLPLTPNGKLDRQLLLRTAPAPERPAAAAYAAPRNEIERALAEIWAEVLGLERVGLQDNFFDLGGHSLLLTQTQMRVREVLGREVPLLKFFEFPTVGSLALHLGGLGDPGEARESGLAPGPNPVQSRDRAQRQRQGLGLQRQRLVHRTRT